MVNGLRTVIPVTGNPTAVLETADLLRDLATRIAQIEACSVTCVVRPSGRAAVVSASTRGCGHCRRCSV